MINKTQQIVEISFIGQFFISLYSLFVSLVVRACSLALNYKLIHSDRFIQQMQGRPLNYKEFLEKLHSNKAFDEKQKHGIFFCSSAGEYEQAKPLIERCKQAQIHSIVVFFSRSGLDFALSQKSKSTSEFFLLSIPDLYFHWLKILTQLDVQFVCIVRHELWPGLIYAACSKFNLQIINVEFKSLNFANFIKLSFLKRFKKIYCLDDKTEQNLLRYGVEKERITKTGDTKYDRVLERAKQQNLIHHQTTDRGFFTLIVGSAWPADIEIVIPTFKELITQNSISFNWRVIIAPHDISSNMIKKIERMILDLNLKCSIETELDLINNDQAVIVLQSMGKLAELYAFAQVAFVGGAMHHRVHNVLEPACYGNSIAFGPYYHTSPEARSMVKEKIATVIHTSQDLKTWWLKEDQRLLANPNQRKNQNSENFVNALAGASNLIFDDLISNQYRK